MKTIIKGGGGSTKVLPNRKSNHHYYCNYIYSDQYLTAALNNNCNYLDNENDINGFILLKNDTYEIQSLNKRLKSILNYKKNNNNNNLNGNFSTTENRIPHLVKRTTLPTFIDDQRINESINNTNNHFNNHLIFKDFPQYQSNPINHHHITIELGVFFDAAAYRIFAPYYNYDDHQLHDMILGYMNGVQAIYYHPSLGKQIDITIVYLEIMKKQPIRMPHFNGEREQLLDSFCDYQQSINPIDDENPRHWDMALYISGLDFYAYENGKRSDVTMGLASVGGVCIAKYACVIAEFGTKSIFNRPYPSAGFVSIYITAHEIGHNLGMHHDSFSNDCSREGFIMSPSRGTQGETTWSKCSRDVVRDLSWATCLYDTITDDIPDEYNAWKYNGIPGQTWNAKKQCEILLTDSDAQLTQPNSLYKICENLQCRTPNRVGHFFAGPALDGTNCGANKWCRDGECQLQGGAIDKPKKVIKGGWSNWSLNGTCQSGCIARSFGTQKRVRECNNPLPVNTHEGCDGLAKDSVLCDDTELCVNTRKKSINEYAALKCTEYSMVIPELDAIGQGLQSNYEEQRLWMACSVFCKRKMLTYYYTPRIELTDLGIDPYFPDGTWCHNDGLENFYCILHHCLPENFQFSKYSLLEQSEDIEIDIGNVQHNLTDRINNTDLINYLSIDQYGNAISKHYHHSLIISNNNIGNYSNDLLIDW